MKKLSYLVIVFAVALIILELQGSENIRVLSINNKPLMGKIGNIEKDEITVVSGSQKIKYKLKNLESIEFLKESDSDSSNGFYPEFEVKLITGDIFTGKILQATDDDRGFIFESLSFGKIPILMRWVDIIKNIPNAENNFTIDVKAEKNELDVLYFAKDVEKEGDDANVDNLIGTINAITKDGIDFTDKFNYFEDYLFEWSKINAVTVFHENKPEIPKVFQAIVSTLTGEVFTGLIGNSDGVQFEFQSPTLIVENYTDDDEEIWKSHVKGLKIKVNDKFLSTLTFRFGNFTYLSDLNPVKSDEYPYFGGKLSITDPAAYWWKYCMDKSVMNKQLYLKNTDGKKVKYIKGIGVHSYSMLSFETKKESKFFMTDIGIEADAGKQASVVFKVFLDDAKKPAYESPTMLENTGFLSIKIDISNADMIHLVVDFADNGDIQDRAIWGNARVLKE